MEKQLIRANEQWLEQLGRPGPEQDDALADLYGILLRGLGYALTNYPRVVRADLHEFAYDALLKILASLHSFRRECRFTTWALKIAVHTAFAELRRRKWIELPRKEKAVRAGTPGVPSAAAEHEAAPDELLGVIAA